MDPDSDFAKVWENMQKYANEVLVLENDDGVAKAQRERYAFFMETSSIEYEIQRKCDLNQVGSKLDEKSYGIAMKKSEYLTTKKKVLIMYKFYVRDIKNVWTDYQKLILK